MIKRVLVVGGAGYVGGSVTDVLLERGIPFTVYDNLIYENHYLKPADFIYGDVRDRSRLGVLLPEYSHIIWLAALVGDGACAIRPELTREINQESMGWLAQYFHGRIIFTSTCSVYGASDQPVTEESPTGPLSVYAETKLAAEQYLQHKDALIFRLGTAFGVPDAYSRLRMDLAINYMTSNAVTKGSLTVYGGNQWRPFIHVKDIGRAIVNNLDTPHRGIFNLATENVTILKVGELIRQETGCRTEITEQKFQDNRNYNAEVTKARQAGIFPADTPYTVSYGIKEIRDLVLSQRVKNVNHDRYSNEKYLLRAIDSYVTRIGYAPPAAALETVAPATSTTPAATLKPSSRPVKVSGDDRGTFVPFLAEANALPEQPGLAVKRIYYVYNYGRGVIRGFHFHKIEWKYFVVVSGAAKIVALNPDLPEEKFVFVSSARKPELIIIPPGFANGWVSLEENTVLVCGSTSSFEESIKDDQRFDPHQWGDVWSVKAR